MNIFKWFSIFILFAENSAESSIWKIIPVMSLLWLSVVLLSLVIEGATSEMVAIWFLPGAFISMILAIFKVNITVQVVVFVALSVILLVLAKTVLKSKLVAKHPIIPTNSDALIGQTAIVTTRIDNMYEVGEVKIEGKYWPARMADEGGSCEVGEFVTVIEIRGIKLICKSK